MTYNTIKYDNLPGFSKLFLDFIIGNKFFDERFPNNKRLFEDKTFLNQVSQSNKNRDLITETILNSMQDIDFSQKQSENLKLLKFSNTLTVVTGQQVGFLGGPIYTLIKALSAVTLSNKLNSFHKDYSFVPIFWIEDNDHDNLESSQITIFDKNYNPRIFNCDKFPDKADRRTVSSRKFDYYINEVIHNVSEVLSGINNNSEIISILKNFYKPYKSWTHTFIELINSLISITGILFISASKLQKTGIFYEAVKRELVNLGKSDELILLANTQLETNHYHIQAKSSKINLFFHKEESRYKIEPLNDNANHFKISNEIYNQNELFNLLSKNHSAFSPNVLLRPIFQDFALPTVAYIGGPSEIGYCSQLKEAYEYFNLSMPAFLPRHTVTLIDKKISRFLEKNEQSTEIFFSKKEYLNIFIKEKLIDKNTETIIKNSIEDIQNIFENLKTHAKSIDPTLEATVDSSANKTKQMIEAIEKKIKSAEIRKHDFLINKYIEASNFLYPFDTFQERIYSPLNFLINIEKDALIANLLEIFKNDPNSHFLIYL